MKTWLFTWNPSRWPWDDKYRGYKEMKNQIQQVVVVSLRGHVATTRAYKKGIEYFSYDSE